MNKARFSYPLILLMVAGCAMQSDLDLLRRDSDEMKNRIFMLEKDINGVRTEARGSIETALRDFEKEKADARRSLADLQVAIDGMKVELQSTAGQIDDLLLTARKPADEIKLLREDLDRRLNSLEDRLATVEKGLAGVQKKVTDMETVRAKAPEPVTPEAVYQKGLDAYRSGNYSAARETFALFLEQYPKHELVPNARYWYGETFYSEKKYEQAILEFQEVIKNFPGRDKVPAAMFKQAAAFVEIGDTKSARYVLRKLVEEYPASEEAKRAKERLKELK